MLHWRTHVVVALACLLGACDMYTWFDVRHSLQPVPGLQCVASALAGAPGIVKVGRAPHSGTDVLLAELQDSIGSKRRRVMITRDSSGITIDYVWSVGLLVGGRPSPVELQQVSQQAQRVLSSVRSACAPGAPDTFECIIDHSRVVSCASPAA